MFAVDNTTAETIRRAFEDDGEMAAVIEFRRHFPLIQDGAPRPFVRPLDRQMAALTASRNRSADRL